MSRREARNWKAMTDEEVIEYYHEHYGNMVVDKLNRTDSGLYKVMGRRGLRWSLPIANRRLQREDNSMKKVQQLEAEFLSKYPGLSRAELRLRDISLYSRMHYAKILRIIPTAIDKLDSAFGSDDEVMAYYRSNYEGVTKTEMASAHPIFYRVMKKRGLHELIPRSALGT